MCSGEVAITYGRVRVWQISRLPRSGRCPSDARATGRRSPRLGTRAISLTAWKFALRSDRKAASMTSTPTSSSISAISSFSSKLMVRRGIVRRRVRWCRILRRDPCRTCFTWSSENSLYVGAGCRALRGSGDLAQPLSARRKPPSRPSGADKKQPAKKQGGQGRAGIAWGRTALAVQPELRTLAAHQHCQTLRSPILLKPLTVWFAGARFHARI